MQALRAVVDWPVGSPAAAAVLHWPEPPPGRPTLPQLAATVGPVDRPFAWASVTKMATALAVLVAAEEGTLSLDEPAGPPGATVAHLLAHASGLGPESPEPLTAPGRRRIYSNVGFEMLAGHLAARAGMDFAEYLAEVVLGPLGLAATTLAPGGSPAHGLIGPVSDLLRLATGLCVPGLVSAGTLAAATTVAFPGLDGVLPGFGRQSPCDWGLGFEVKGTKHPHWTGAANSPRTFGHFGQAGGFCWIDPESRLALVSLSDTAFGPWAATAWPALADAVLADAGPAERDSGLS